MDVSVNYDLKSKRAMAIPKDKLIRYSVLNSALKTHKLLSIEDRHFAITHILGLDIDDDVFTKFVLQIYKLSNTGRFSLTFNADLDTHIKARKSERLPILIVTAGTHKAWPEVYDNSCLCEDDIKSIEEMQNREYYAILNAIETSDCVTDLNNILPCDVSKSQEFTVNDTKIKYTSLYSKCYQTVCMYESEQRGKIISLDSEIPQVAYVADKHEGEYTKFCIPLMVLLQRLAKQNYDNPQTGIRFSDTLLSQLLDKYRVEIAIYQKYLKIINKNKCE